MKSKTLLFLFILLLVLSTVVYIKSYRNRTAEQKNIGLPLDDDIKDLDSLMKDLNNTELEEIEDFDYL